MLTFIQNIVNSDNYFKILQDHIGHFFYVHEIVQQENVHSHKAENMRTFFENIDLFCWNIDPQSADLKIIKNLRHILKLSLQQAPRKCAGLNIACDRGIRKIPIEYIKKLYNSEPNRLFQVEQNKGYRIKYR